MIEAKEPKNGVWVGLRRCGCCVAVCVDDGEPRMKKHVNAAKREYLRDGLSVLNVSWQEWQTKHLPTMSKNCPHRVPPPAQTQAETP